MNDNALTNDDIEDYNDEVIGFFMSEGLLEGEVKILLKLFERAIVRAETVRLKCGGFDLREFPVAQTSGLVDFHLGMQRKDFKYEQCDVHAWLGTFSAGERLLEVVSLALRKPAR